MPNWHRSTSIFFSVGFNMSLNAQGEVCRTVDRTDAFFRKYGKPLSIFQIARNENHSPLSDLCGELISDLFEKSNQEKS